MLTLTENAQAAVKGLTTEAGLPEGGGVRIALTAANDQLELSLVPEPQATDQVVETEEARVFVAEETGPLLEGQTLDAGQTAEGVGFTLRPQEPQA
ncbi:HesB/IscA family protein [Georgenia subflava]|uniref:Fe-S cluster assembly protein HesB n=1 Tax=Georgenia subflava TaxID=1622177 RepID=A0A6N7EIN2_9MICO|nr:Fe-S cluster assembly protein HesB [Georgenia subflava]MPV36943.1 Fe-S cluster assembly protein HesB [Georgenia subflava]